MQGARHVARQIRRRIAGQPTTAFRYTDKGIMATIGRNAAVAELAFGLRTSGFLAWVMWLMLHLVLLIGFRNRMNVLVNFLSSLCNLRGYVICAKSAASWCATRCFARRRGPP